MPADTRFLSPHFPRASTYHPDWIQASVSGGANPLWLTEWLSSDLELTPGMRVLDLGCGRAISSIFLRREFGVQVWATDLWFSATENYQRIADADVSDGVFPIHADARSLPFANEFFDAIVSIDSFFYYGTDDHYLNYLARFLKPDGQLGIAGVGLMHELDDSLPEHLRSWWTPDLCCLHSALWWRRHWQKTAIIDVSLADTMPDGWQRWLEWQRVICPENTTELQAIEADQGATMGYVRVIGRRSASATLFDPAPTIPLQYSKHRLLRNGE